MKFYSFWRSLASFRVRIALNIKGIVPDEVISVDLMKGEQCQPSYKAVNPQMLLPALVDGDGPIMFQSVAIMEYLEETHPQPVDVGLGGGEAGQVGGGARVVLAQHARLVELLLGRLEVAVGEALLAA